MLNRRSRLFATIFLASLALLLPGLIPVTHAYGRTALWQIAISGNCDNPSLCGTPGGFWVWAEFDSGSTGDATVTDCAHMLSTAPFGGAQHVNIEITSWTISSGSAGPQTFFVTSEIDTITGHTGGSPIQIVIPSEFFDTGVPAVPGHYSTQQILGFSAPGVSFQMQVVQLNK